MSTLPTIDLPLIDHHCHGVSPQQLDYTRFQAMFSESYMPPPPGTNEFQKPLGLMIRRYCAPLLDLEPFVSGERYVERRFELGAEEVNRRMIRAGNFDRLIIDTGFRSDTTLGFEAMAEVAGRPTHEVVRIEAVAEEVARSGVSAGQFAQVFRNTLLAKSKHAIGLKTIVAYRCTFKIDQTSPSDSDVVDAAGRWLREIEQTGKVRLSDPVLERLALWSAGEICRDRRFPLQVHVGFGDPDVYMHACDPTHFTDFIRDMEKWSVPITLLHNYPFIREAAWLSEVFQNVYIDTGVIQNWTGPMSEKIVGESLEMGKFSKLLFSTDAIGLSELYYLGSVLFRRALQRVLDQWIREDMCTLADADEIICLVATENARRIYGLGNT